MYSFFNGGKGSSIFFANVINNAAVKQVGMLFVVSVPSPINTIPIYELRAILSEVLIFRFFN